MRLERPLALAVLCTLGLAVAGCDRSGLGQGLPRVTCSSCHGSEQNPAPPADLDGNFAVSNLGVGAHQVHLTDGRIRGALACAECHTVPEQLDAPGHVDPRPAELAFGLLATADGAAPAWDRAQGSCTGTYCHGSTLHGGLHTAPAWTRVDGTQITCGSCHGYPPPPPHPTSSSCRDCHPDTLTATGEIDLVKGKHLDGHLDVSGTAGCSLCHGDALSAAPPKDLSGNTGTSAPGVGAHRAHLGYSGWHAPLACNECHRVPATLDAPGHIDSLPPAELTWGALATAMGASPAFDGTSCSGVYCHGTAIADAGGRHPNPIWTLVDGSQSACGSCHSLPPGGGHPQNPNCEMCHTRVIAEGRTWVDPARHIDGQVEASATACNACHGDADSAAPPLDVQGNQDTTARGVGAHRAHLGSSDWHATLTCRECHRVPAQVGDPGHNDTALPAELTWGPLAASGAADPAFDGATCSGVYCHGATLPDQNGSNIRPAWTTVDDSQAACGTCHGLPPGGSHPQEQDCHRCHRAVIAADGSFAAPERHVDGHLDLSSPHPDGYADPDQHGADFNDRHPADCTVCHGTDLQGGLSGLGCESCHPNFRTNCTFCHGGRDNQSGAPPASVAGALNPTIRGVGAHTAHLSASSWHRSVSCSACHVLHANALDTGHIDPRPAELTWGDISQAGGTQAAWDGVTCSGTYCHGATLLEGGSLLDPTWTQVDGTQAACGTCHGLPPGGGHPDNDQCQVCHGEVIAAGYAFVAPEKHIDGQVQAAGGHPQGYDSPLVHGQDALLGVKDCRTCHGQNLDGGNAGQGCDQCHPNGWRTNCTFCHGGVDNQTGAPAEDLRNRTDRALQTVGAHTEHVTRTIHPAYDCVQCHQKPASLLVAGHMFDATPGVSEVRLAGGLSQAGTYAAPACNNLYCHGTGRTNRSVADFVTPINNCHACHPDWTSGAGIAGMSGEHYKHVVEEGASCSTCHSQVVNASNSIIGPDLHVNGAKNVNVTGMTYSGGNCTGTCHGETHSGWNWYGN